VVACGGAGERPSFSYVCVEPNRAGKLLVDKCEQLQVRSGRNFSLLKEGRPVENKMGEVVMPHQVRCTLFDLICQGLFWERMWYLARSAAQTRHRYRERRKKRPASQRQTRGNPTQTAQSKATQRKAKLNPKTHTRGSKQACSDNMYTCDMW
jgi:hypothetical protein